MDIYGYLWISKIYLWISEWISIRFIKICHAVSRVDTFDA